MRAAVVFLCIAVATAAAAGPADAGPAKRPVVGKVAFGPCATGTAAPGTLFVDGAVTTYRDAQRVTVAVRDLSWTLIPATGADGVSQPRLRMGAYAATSGAKAWWMPPLHQTAEGSTSCWTWPIDPAAGYQFVVRACNPAGCRVRRLITPPAG